MATKKAVTQPKPKKAKGPPPDPVNKQTLEHTYREGELARQNRQSLDSCPYQITDPLWLSWERGWKAALFAESATPALLHALQQAGLTTGIPDLEELEADQRVAILDWLDTMPADEFSQGERAEFDARRPAFVSITSKVVPADEEFAELRVISVHGAAAADSKIPAAEPVGSPSAEEPRAPVDALPPLQEIPPANDVEAELQDLLRQFDDVGVSIVEEQWRKLDDGAQSICRRWLSGRLNGAKSPVPNCLLMYSTAALKSEYAPYAAEQETARQERFCVAFDKPSVVAPGEDDEGKIKVVAKVAADVLSGALADRLFRYKRCRIQFSTRRLDQWNQAELFESHPIYSTTSDVSGYKASRHETSFSFLVDQAELSVHAAFKELWGLSGTIIVEVLGEAEGRKQPDKPADQPLRGQKTLPNTADEDQASDEQAAEPAEEEEVAESATFLMAVSGELAIKAMAEEEDDGWYVDIDAETPEGWEDDNEFLGSGVQAPRVSMSEAVSAAVGQLVDHWQRWAGQPDADRIISQLKDWLSNLAAGKSVGEIVTEMNLVAPEMLEAW